MRTGYLVILLVLFLRLALLASVEVLVGVSHVPIRFKNKSNACEVMRQTRHKVVCVPDTHSEYCGCVGVWVCGCVGVYLFICV